MKKIKRSIRERELQGKKTGDSLRGVPKKKGKPDIGSSGFELRREILGAFRLQQTGPADSGAEQAANSTITKIQCSTSDIHMYDLLVLIGVLP